MQKIYKSLQYLTVPTQSLSFWRHDMMSINSSNQIINNLFLLKSWQIINELNHSCNWLLPYWCMSKPCDLKVITIKPYCLGWLFYFPQDMMCFFKQFFHVNVFPQIWQENIGGWWSRLCCFNNLCRLNCLWHISHSCIPFCLLMLQDAVFKWRSSVCLYDNCFPHNGHACSLFKIWLALCATRTRLEEHLFPHVSHSKVAEVIFSWLISLWRWSQYGLLNDLPQWVHRCFFASCVLRCCCSPSLLEKSLWQMSHLKSCGPWLVTWLLSPLLLLKFLLQSWNTAT